MNQIIRELLKQAEERYPKHLAVAVPEVVLRQDALEKFAQLIVRECVQVAGDNAVATTNPDLGMAKLEVVKAIIRHFGDE